MTNPAASNSGFTALVGVASALAGSSDALETGDINVEAMQAFLLGGPNSRQFRLVGRELRSRSSRIWMG
ncbi:MAG: hypothetical protein IPM39_25825 [Chloroflexi bacterium]|nr:hypothetical protein [Chloroflexota bacterium]